VKKSEKVKKISRVRQERTFAFLYGYDRLRLDLPLLLWRHNVLTTEQVIQALDLPPGIEHTRLIRARMREEGWKEKTVRVGTLKMKAWHRSDSAWDESIVDLVPWQDYPEVMKRSQRRR
jgi:hypothetical protein